LPRLRLNSISSSSTHFELALAAFSDREETIPGLLSCVKYLYSAILLNLLGDLHETPPTIVCEDIMTKYWWNLI